MRKTSVLLLILLTSCASTGTEQTTLPPRCSPAIRLDTYTPLDPALFPPAPLPPQQVTGVDYGDWPGVVRAQRTNIQYYNATIPVNAMKASRNRDKIVETHNTAVDKLNANCDVMWATYKAKVLKLKTEKKSRSFKNIFN